MKIKLQTKDGTYKIKDINRRKAIRERCLNCSGWELRQVRNCEITKCKLHPFRSGIGEQDAKAREKVIRVYCLKCSGGKHSEVKKCPVKDCPLFAFRKNGLDRSVEIALEPETDHIEVLSEVN